MANQSNTTSEFVIIISKIASNSRSRKIQKSFIIYQQLTQIRSNQIQRNKYPIQVLQLNLLKIQNQEFKSQINSKHTIQQLRQKTQLLTKQKDNKQIHKNMKTLGNPTTFFFKQAEALSADKPSQEMLQFANQLLNRDQCQLCKQNYDILIRIPRIMIHCGHTFCTPCLRQFYMNRRVRCPMCLKLVKQLDTLERLPINHSIFEYLVEKDKQICQKTNIKPIIENAGQFLFAEFEKSQKEAHLKDKEQKIDPQSGLPFCVFHPDRVEHFFCAVHSSAGCRVCSEIGHSKPQCKVIDLYQIDDPNQLQQMIGKSRIQTHGESNKHQPELQDEDSSQQEGIIISEETGKKYVKSRTGKLLPVMDYDEDGEQEYFNDDGCLDGSGIEHLRGDMLEGEIDYDDDDDDDQE